MQSNKNKEKKMSEAQYKKIKHSDIPNEFIFHLSRHSYYFKNNSIMVYKDDPSNKEKTVLLEFDAPEGLVLCDLCGAEIIIEKIPLYIHYGISTDILSAKALCHHCLNSNQFQGLIHFDHLKPVEDNLVEINEFRK
ncbi:hypothetical protein LCGC14_1063460 [marine sediment metagenome]|uniref:Uncharacterized protein n=1 Tax=marine sediment metagenome TaxID=412755 RepID=A0A0F9Q3G9_9ZZZZ